jgi:integrase
VEKKYLRQRRQGWYVRVRVPPALREEIGDTHVVRSLKTRDLATARQRRWKAVADIKAHFAEIGSQRAVGASGSNGGPAERFISTAKDLQRKVRLGLITPDEAWEQWEIEGDAIVDTIPRDRDGDYLDDPGTKQAFDLATSLLRSPDVSLLSSAVADYLSEIKPRVRNQTLATKTRRLRQLQDWLKTDRKTEAVTKTVAGRFVTDVLMKQNLSAKTVRDTISDLTAFFGWCESRGLVPSNPFAGQSKTVRETSRGVRQKEKRRPWTTDELKTYFTALKREDPRWTMAAIALYTGMRANEIAETQLCDVFDSHIHIPEGKTEASVRDVPLHRAIKPLVKRLKECSTDGYLISGLKRGGEDKKRAHYILKRIGASIRSSGITDRSVVFHSLRGNFAQALENNGVPENLAQQIIGHKKQSLTFGLYSHGVDLPVLARSVNKISFGAIDDLVRQDPRSHG